MRIVGLASRLPALAAAGAGALVLRAVYGPPHLGYDAWYALAWGREIAHGMTPDFSGPVAPTPHPLANLASAGVSVFGARGVTLIAAISLVSFAALGMASFMIGRRLFGVAAGALTALVVLTRPFVVSEMLFCSVDIPFLALVASAGALLVAPRRRQGVALALLVLAGMLRPEGWLLACALAVVCWWSQTGPSRRWLVAGALFAPLAWAAFDLIITGDALHSLHGTKELAQELGRPHSASTAFSAIPRYLQAILGTGVAWAGAISALAALWLALDRAALPLAIAGLGLVGFLVLGLADLPLLYRYMLLPGLALVLLVGFGGFGWSIAGTTGPLRWSMLGLSAAIVVLVATSASDDHTALRAAVSGTRLARATQSRLAQLVREPTVERATRRCRRIAVPGPRVVPELAYRLGLRTSDVVVQGGDAARASIAFSPSPGRVAASYTLIPDNSQTLTTAQLAGLEVIGHNAAWTAYGSPRCGR